MPESAAHDFGFASLGGHGPKIYELPNSLRIGVAPILPQFPAQYYSAFPAPEMVTLSSICVQALQDSTNDLILRNAAGDVFILRQLSTNRNEQEAAVRGFMVAIILFQGWDATRDDWMDVGLR